MRRATHPGAWCRCRHGTFLSTLSLRRATSHNIFNTDIRVISIHALLAESDAGAVLSMVMSFISIHALLAESDSWRLVTNLLCSYFYPRSPCGERPVRLAGAAPAPDISIHALLAESDHATIKTIQDNTISIHALLAESDTFLKFLVTTLHRISIHALLAESDHNRS